MVFCSAGRGEFMKKTILKFVVVVSLLSFSTLVPASEVTVYCDHEYKNQIVEVNTSSSVDACVADLIWGTKNVCFEGDAKTLAELINNQLFRWVSSGYSAVDASVTNEGAVKYTGVDAMSFFMAERTLLPCTPEFFK
jgi:hypothetical protein